MTIGAKLLRGNEAPAVYGQQKGSTAKLPTLAEGESISIRCRYAEPLITEITAPTSVQWEGPYIRLYTSINIETLRGVTGRVWTGAETISGFDANGDAEDIVLPDKATAPYYEFDAINCPLINAPYDCQPELYTDLSGVWCFDWIKFDRPRDYQSERGVKYPSRQSAVNARLFPQTRLVYGLNSGDEQPNTRTLDVPLGCVEIEQIGTCDAGTIPQLMAGETDNSAGNGSAIYSLADAAYLGFRRVSVGGARKVVITAGATGQASGIIFWCAL